MKKQRLVLNLETGEKFTEEYDEPEQPEPVDHELEVRAAKLERVRKAKTIADLKLIIEELL